METTTQTFHQSSTGMLHRVGCSVLRPYRSRVHVLTEDAAAEIEFRCTHCHPRPNGTWFDQEGRKALTATEQRAEGQRIAAAQHAAARGAADAAWAEMQSADLDEALRIFLPLDEANDPAAGDAYRTMMALAPESWNPMRRARELGL